MVIEVSFKGNRREFFEWPFPEAPAVKVPVIVEVEHGEDFGRVHATGDLALTRKAGTTHGKASRNPLRKALRAANGEEIARAEQLRADEYNVRVRAIEKVRTLGLDLKVSDTEWQHDKKRLTVYFTAEQRVDFRQLVRQLEGLFGTRVHMWHIGVRDEAKRVDGLGRCGRQLCSASWLPELVPVKSSVAKDQHLSTLNPAQISGACGRLMCCLRYEHEFYVQQRKRFPKEGKIVRTSVGDEKVLSLDIFRETVTVRSVAGEARVVPLEQLKAEIAAVLADPTGATAVAIQVANAAEDHGAEPTSSGTPDAVRRDSRRPDVPREGRPRERQREDRSPNQRREERPQDQRAEGRPQQERRERRPQEHPRGGGPRDERREGSQRTQAPSDTPVSPPAGAPDAQPGNRAADAPSANESADGKGRRRRRGRRGGRRGHGSDRGGQPGPRPPGGSSPPESPPPGQSEPRGPSPGDSGE